MFNAKEAAQARGDGHRSRSLVQVAACWDAGRGTTAPPFGMDMRAQCDASIGERIWGNCAHIGEKRSVDFSPIRTFNPVQ